MPVPHLEHESTTSLIKHTLVSIKEGIIAYACRSCGYIVIRTERATLVTRLGVSLLFVIAMILSLKLDIRIHSMLYNTATTTNNKKKPMRHPVLLWVHCPRPRSSVFLFVQTQFKCFSLVNILTIINYARSVKTTPKHIGRLFSDLYFYYLK